MGHNPWQARFAGPAWGSGPGCESDSNPVETGRYESRQNQ